MHTLDRDPMISPDAPLPGRSRRRSGAATRSARSWLPGAVALLALVTAAVCVRADAAESTAPRFDATTLDSFARSYEAIITTLPAADVPGLELAVERTLRYYALTTGRSLGPADLINLFGGKTAEQVVATAPSPDDPTLS